MNGYHLKVMNIHEYMDINSKLIKVFTNVFDLSLDEIHVNLSQDDVAKWDSLGQMELIVALEKEFNITLELEEIILMNSIKNIARVLVKKGIQIYVKK